MLLSNLIKFLYLLSKIIISSIVIQIVCILKLIHAILLLLLIFLKQ